MAVRGLVFDYDTTRALDDVSFTLEAATVTALVGPNGAGKTTLLRCLAGLEQPVAGSIAIDGIDVLADPRAAHRRLGFLQDFFGVYEALTVGQNLLYAAAAQGLPAAEQDPAMRQAAESVGLADRLDQRAGNLSRGLRQRLAIARAIVHGPALLLLDEPAAGLDPEARQALSALIRRLHAGGMTVLVSSHILAELDEYSTHMLALRGGRTGGTRPIGSDAAGVTRIRLQLAGTAEAARAFLERRHGVTAVRDEPGGLSFALEGGEPGRLALLRALVEADLPVSGFTPLAVDLEQLYRAEAAS